MKNYLRIWNWMAGYSLNEDAVNDSRMLEDITLEHFQDAIKHSGLSKEEIIEFADQESVLSDEEIESLRG
jgi:hypothetical protein